MSTAADTLELLELISTLTAARSALEAALPVVEAALEPSMPGDPLRFSLNHTVVRMRRAIADVGRALEVGSAWVDDLAAGRRDEWEGGSNLYHSAIGRGRRVGDAPQMTITRMQLSQSP